MKPVVEEEASAAAAEASTTVGIEDKLESSDATQRIDKTITDGVTKEAKEQIVEEKPRVIPPPGDGQRIYQIDPMLERFRNHLDHRYAYSLLLFVLN